MDYIFLYCGVEHQKFAELFLKSLWKHNRTCRVVWYGNQITFNDMRRAWLHGEIEPRIVDPVAFEERLITHKIECLKKVRLNENDRIICFDPDILLQDDPFKMFEGKPDMIYTTRHYKCKFSVNAGVFGFAGTKAGKRALNFFVEQLHKKDWEEYKAFLKRYEHYYMCDWWVDQDFICCVDQYGLPFEAKAKNCGPEWNYCPDYGSLPIDPIKYDNVKKDLFSKIGTKYKALHFKGKMKHEMLEATKEMGL